MTYANTLDLATGAFLLTGVLIIWRRELTSLVMLLGWQGAALAAIPITEGIRQEDIALIGVGVGVAALKAVVLPMLLTRAIGSAAVDRRESTPLLSTTASLLTAGALVMIAFAVSRPVTELASTPATRAVPAAIAVVLLGMFVMVSRRLAVSQAVGFLMLDNGIAATAFLTTAGVPLVVELGASLDLMFAVLILGVLTGRLRREFGDTDLDQLRELRDR